jgi:hypothetical protein
MIIVKLMGGLGNQMFEYAAGRALALKFDTPLKCDTTFLLDRTIKNIVFRDFDLDIFPNISFPTASAEEIHSLTTSKKSFIHKIAAKISKSTTYFKEQSFAYDKTFESLGSNTYLDGYWQSEKYFKPVEAEIRNDFSFSAFQIASNEELKKHILSCNSVCLNVRRGDFVNHEGSSSHHGFTGLDYYNKGFEVIRSKINDPHYYIFSDDIEWCRANITPGTETTFVGHEVAGKKFADYLQLMTNCKHFLIPNSSFAWWAAWLNTHEQKVVITPKKWFNDPSIKTNDLIPSDWIRI